MFPTSTDRCHAITRRGRQCRIRTSRRSEDKLCHIHLCPANNCARPQTTRCVANTRKGSQCKLRTKTGTHCHVHNFLAIENIPEKASIKKMPIPEKREEPIINDTGEKVDPEILRVIAMLEEKCSGTQTPRPTPSCSHPHMAQQIQRFLDSEVRKELDIYRGLLRMLRCYTSTDEIDIREVELEITMSVAYLRKQTDRNVNNLVKRSKQMSKEQPTLDLL